MAVVVGVDVLVVVGLVLLVVVRLLVVVGLVLLVVVEVGVLAVGVLVEVVVGVVELEMVGIVVEFVRHSRAACVARVLAPGGLFSQKPVKENSLRSVAVVGLDGS